MSSSNGKQENFRAWTHLPKKLKGFKVDPPRMLCPKIQGYASTKLKWDNAKYKTFPTLLQRFKGMKLRVKTKNRIVEALVFPLVTHGCESWTLRKEEKENELKLLKCVDMEKTTQNVMGR
ncbi:hypothetical protein LAZ67_2001539 [Cordylochernes scorpioides]|uniref:Uncharacterized protein n=1 Tax=Cordylochernes scorpioides TaxID=51811 RepID=A0ABY6K2Z4_9ARAC|nr:hypothetical protein LAZ67_2001539 [Cordylochernes scorpioides]